MTSPPPTVWHCLRAHDPQAIIDFLTALGFQHTVAYSDDGGIVHAELLWPEGGGVMLGAHRPDRGVTITPGTGAAYVVTTDIDAVLTRAENAGLDVGEGIYEPDYGSRDLQLSDAEGNSWTFGTYAGHPRD